MINQLGKEAFDIATEKGFYDEPPNIPTRIALIHSEVSEALEADRDDNFCELDNENWDLEGRTLRDDLGDDIDDITFKLTFENHVKDNFEDEMADIMIRVMDLATYLEIDLEAHIKAKMRYNSLREHKNGGKKY